MGVNSATLLVEHADAGNACQVLRRISVSDWDEEEIKRSMAIYENIKEKSLEYIAHVSTILLQNTFLSIVIDYYEAGDMAAYLEKSSMAFANINMCHWLLMIARGIKELHEKVSSCFYGLALDHIFIESFGSKSDEDSSIATRLRLGIPSPERSYFSVLEERKSAGADLALEYPPEVLQNKMYHPKHSDIWHLGALAEQLLKAARLPVSSLPLELFELVEKMKSVSMENRPGIDDVIKRLSSLAVDKETFREEKIGNSPGKAIVSSSGSKTTQRARPLSSREVGGSLSKKQSITSEKKRTEQESRLTKLKTQSSTLLKDEQTLPGSHHPNACSSETKVSTEGPSVSPRRRRGDNTDWHYGAIKKLEELEQARLKACNVQGSYGDNRTLESTLLHASLRDPQEEDHGRHGEGRLSSHRYIDAAEGMHFDTGTVVPFQFNREELHAGRIDPNTRVIKQMLGGSSPASSSKDTRKGVNTSPPARASTTPTRLPSPGTIESESVRKKKVSGRPKGFVHPPFSYAKTNSGVVPILPSRTEDRDGWHSSGKKKGRPAGKQASRKAESCLVSATDGVFIYTPFIQHTKREYGMTTPEILESSASVSSNDRKVKEASKALKEGDDVTLVSPPVPSHRTPSVHPHGPSRDSPSLVYGASGSRSPYRSSSVENPHEMIPLLTMRTPSPREAPPLPFNGGSPLAKHAYSATVGTTFSSRPVAQQAIASAPDSSFPPSLLSQLSASFGDSKRDHGPPFPPTPKLPTSMNHDPTGKVGPLIPLSGGQPTPHRELHSPPHKQTTTFIPPSELAARAPSHQMETQAQQSRSSRGEKHRHKSRKSQEKSSRGGPSLTPAMMEWAVDSLRGSIRSLVKDRTRYGEIMVEVAGFVRKTEEERLSVSENSKLVRRLQSRLRMDDNERTRDAALCLCSQLVALEGLSKLLRDPQN